MNPCVSFAPINDCVALEPSVETSVAEPPVAVVPPMVPVVPPVCAFTDDAKDKRTTVVARNRNVVIMVVSLLVSDR